MQVETAFDLRYNIAAMYIAILRDDIATPEQAFAIISEAPVTKATNDEDVLDMIAMRNQGMYYKDIAKIYGFSDSYIAKKVKQYKKDLSSCSLKRSATK